MKKQIIALGLLSLASIASYAAPVASSVPASKEWVLQQIAAANTQLTQADWSAVCTNGSPANVGGCFGSASSGAFAKISRGLGGFATLANIDTANSPAGSVFVKAFFADTNTPVSTASIAVTLSSGNIARCGIFLQQGTGLDTVGASIDTSVVNSSTGGPSIVAHPITINAATVAVPMFTGAGTVAEPKQPLYLVCMGVASNGATAASLSATGVIAAV